MSKVVQAFKGLSPKKKLILKYFLLWCICTAVIFIPFVPGRKSLVIKDDGFNECYPSMIYFANWVKQLFGGHFKMFDLLIGYGDDVIGNLSWFGLTDVLLLPFCFAPAGLLELSYSASIIFRLFLAGILFLFTVSEDVPDHAKLAGAMLYSFCPYVFTYTMIFLPFATPMVWIPVIVAGVKKMIDGRSRFSKRLFGGVFFLAILGFYYIYMAVIVFGTYLLLYLIVQWIKKKDVQTSVGNVLRVIGVVALAVGSAAVVLLPEILHFLKSPRTSSISLSFAGLLGIKGNIGDIDRLILFPRFDQIGINGMIYDIFKMPFISCVSLICFCYLIHHVKKIGRGLLLASAAVCGLAMFSDGISLLMNAFSMTYARYFVFIFFAVAYMTANVIPLLGKYWNGLDTLCTLVIMVIGIYFMATSGQRVNAVFVV
jgi:uncharacterized membrane protein YfhO